MKKVIITGANGFIGMELIHYFLNKKNYLVVGLSRKLIKINNENFKSVLWNNQDVNNWGKELEDAELLINLAGKSVDCRYTEDNKTEIYQSRIHSVRILAKAIENCATPPKLWVNFASATIYMHSYKENNEETGLIGNGFSVDVCKRWEQTFFEQLTPKTRKINFSTAIVFGKTGGVFPVLKKLAKFGLGGTMGNGKQFVSWIHLEDLCRAVDFVNEEKNLEGIFNLTSPNPITNEHLQKTIRKTLLLPFGLPQSKFLLKIGARILKTETELILKCRYVVPKKLKDSQFCFNFKTIEECVLNLK